MTGPHAVGVLGVGQMGGGMVRTLLRSGWRVFIAPRRPEAHGELVEAGAELLADASAIAGRVDRVITSLPDGTAVRDVLWGDGGLLSGHGWQGIVVETSTISPGEARSLAEEVQAAGAAMLDAPVSGGPAGAETGSLSVMVGGPEAVLEQVRPLLETIGSRVVRIGGPGAGQVAKACNQLIVMGTIVAVAEALTVAEHAGVEASVVREALLGGLASSVILDTHGARMLAGDFEPGGQARFHAKDIAAIRDVMAADGLALPLFEAVSGRFEELIAEPGGGALDHSAVYTRYPREPRPKP